MNLAIFVAGTVLAIVAARPLSSPAVRRAAKSSIGATTNPSAPGRRRRGNGTERMDGSGCGPEVALR